MQRSRVIGAIFTVVLFGSLALTPSGCSNDDSLTSSPGFGLPGSGHDGYPPATPASLGVLKATDHGFKLTWTANTEEDLVGYRLYVYDPSPYRGDSYICAHGTCLIDPDQTWFLYDNDLSYGAHYFALSALDEDGNESVRSAPCEFYYSGPDNNDANLEGSDTDYARRPATIGGSSPNDPKEDDALEGQDQD